MKASASWLDDKYPQLLDTFLSFGFHPLANPFLRNKIARYVTIERTGRRLNVNAQELTAALNAARPPRRAGTYSLPVLSVH